jgi:catalase
MPAKKSKKPADKGTQSEQPVNEKINTLQPHTEDSTGQLMTTNHGVRINDDQNSLKAGDRGATLLEDFILREKITHFDHERIPERIVHARGSGAHGVFQVYQSMAHLTKAKFLQNP